MLRPTPRRKLVSRSCPSARSKATCTAPHGSKPRADFSGKARALQRRWLREASVPAEKLFPITGEGARRIVDIEEGDALGEFGVVKIARQQRAGLEVHFGLHVEQSFVAQVAQHPFPVAGDGQAARAARDVAQFQNRELHRRIHRHINPQLGDDAVLGVLEHGVAKAMPNDVGVAPRAGSGVGDQNCPVCSSRM